MMGKRQLLVDGDAEASNSAKIDSGAIDYKNGHVDLGKPMLRTTRQVNCVFLVLSFSLFDQIQSVGSYGALP